MRWRCLHSQQQRFSTSKSCSTRHVTARRPELARAPKTCSVPPRQFHKIADRHRPANRSHDCICKSSSGTDQEGKTESEFKPKQYFIANNMLCFTVSCVAGQLATVNDAAASVQSPASSVAKVASTLVLISPFFFWGTSMVAMKVYA